MAAIQVKDDIYHRLAQRAAEEKTTVANLIEPLLDRFAGHDQISDAGHNPSAEDRRQAFNEWMSLVRQRAGRYPPGFVVDDSREGIYAGRGE